MNRILLSLSSVLLFAGATHAQVGIRAGANLATLATRQSGESRNASSNGRLGYQLGVYYEKQVTSRLSILPEVQYSRQNMELAVEDYSISDGSYAANYELRLHYLHVPILGRIAFHNFYLEAGPQGSFQLAAHEKGTETIGSIAGSYDRSFDRPATDRYRRFDVGLCAGAGIKLPAGFGLGIRASAGFISLTHFWRVDNQYKGNLRNQAVQASLSYQLQPKL